MNLIPSRGCQNTLNMGALGRQPRLIGLLTVAAFGPGAKKNKADNGAPSSPKTFLGRSWHILACLGVSWRIGFHSRNLQFSILCFTFRTILPTESHATTHLNWLAVSLQSAEPGSNDLMLNLDEFHFLAKLRQIPNNLVYTSYFLKKSSFSKNSSSAL